MISQEYVSDCQAGTESEGLTGDKGIGMSFKMVLVDGFCSYITEGSDRN